MVYITYPMKGKEKPGAGLRDMDPPFNRLIGRKIPSENSTGDELPVN
jgi:hypothetical protein